MSRYENPNQFEGSDVERIQSAVDAAAKSGKRVIIPRHNQGKNAANSHLWLLDAAIRLPSNITVELDNCHLKLSDRCRDNFFRSANCGIGITDIKPAENIHIIGHGSPILEGADHPRSTGDSGKVLGERTFGTDAGASGNDATGDWRNIGILMASVSHFSIENIRIIDSHCWAISLEYCAFGTLRNLDFDSTSHKIIDGKEEKILNQDGVDLRRGCHSILIENISGNSGDDLIALTAIPARGHQSGDTDSTAISGDQKSTFPGIHDVIIRNVRGYCADGCSIIRLLNTMGLPLENIIIDGVIDTSETPGQSKVALRIGEDNPRYGGLNPLGTMRHIVINNVVSRAKRGVFIRGTLVDSSISNVLQTNGTDDAVFFHADSESRRNVEIHNCRTVATTVS